MKNVSFFEKPSVDMIRNQMLAQRLAKLAEPTPNEEVGGIVVKKSPLEFLAKGLAGYGAAKAEENVYNSAKEAENKRFQMMAQFLGVGDGGGGMQPSAGGGGNPRASLYGQLLAIDPTGELAVKQKMEDAKMTDMMKNSGWMGVTPDQQRTAWQQDAFKGNLDSGLQADVDPQGNITARPVQGVAEYQSSMEQLLAQVQEAEKAKRDMIEVDTPNGRVMMTREQAANIASGGGPQGQGADPALAQGYDTILPLPLDDPNADPLAFTDNGLGAPAQPQPSALPDAGNFPGIPLVDKSVKDSRLKTQEALNTDFISGSYRPALEASQVARDSNTRLDALRSIDLTNATGWGTETKASLGRVLTGLGLAPEEVNNYVSDADKFKAVVSQAVNQDLLAQKGPQTEGDAQRAYNIQASLGNTPQANQFIIDMAQAVNNLKIKKAEFYANNLPEAVQKGDLIGLDAAWSQSIPSVFDDPLMKKYNQPGAAPAAASSGMSSEIQDLLQYMSPEERALFQQ